MDGGVVYLAYSSKNADNDAQSLIACKHCRNKTFKLLHFVDEFPLVQCAACDAHIGRMGWLPDV